MRFRISYVLQTIGKLAWWFSREKQICYPITHERCLIVFFFLCFFSFVKRWQTLLWSYRHAISFLLLRNSSIQMQWCKKKPVLTSGVVEMGVDLSLLGVGVMLLLITEGEDPGCFCGESLDGKLKVFVHWEKLRTILVHSFGEQVKKTIAQFIRSTKDNTRHKITHNTQRHSLHRIHRKIPRVTAPPTEREKGVAKEVAHW